MDPDLKLIETSRYQITPLARWLLFISFGLLWIFKLNTWVFFFICHKHRLDGYWLGTSFRSKSVSTNSSFPIKVKAWYFQAHYSYKVSVIRERWSTEKRGRNHFEIANHLFLLPVLSRFCLLLLLFSTNVMFTAFSETLLELKAVTEAAGIFYVLKIIWSWVFLYFFHFF